MNTKRLMSALPFLFLAACGFAAGDGFGLNAVSYSSIKQDKSNATPAIPAPSGMVKTKAPNIAAPILDMSLKLPFAAINKRMADMGDMLKVNDASAPAFSKEGDHIIFQNVTINYNGIKVLPVIRFKPSFEGDNKLALKILKIDLDLAFGPSKSAMPQLNKDDVMAYAVNMITTMVNDQVNAAFAANKVALKAGDVLSFSYDKTGWVLHTYVSPNFVAPLLPGLLTNLYLTAFNFDDKGFMLSVHSGTGIAIAQVPGCNLVLSDGLFTNFISQFMSGPDMTLKPQGHDGGVKFRADGKVELAGMVHVTTIIGKPNAYFTATVTPALPAPNTIRLTFDKIEVNQAYGIGIPGFVNGWLQKKIIAGTMDTILTNTDLAKVMTATKIDDKTVQLTLKNSAILPSFANGAAISSMHIGQGLMYLALSL